MEMLRLTKIRYVDEPTAVQIHDGEDFEPYAMVTFEGLAGESAVAEFELKIRQRGSDEALVARAKEVLAEAIGKLHEEAHSAPPTVG
jgi:hypothetical protein